MQKVPMVKIIRMVKRRSDLALAQFKAAWLERLPRLAAGAAALQKVVATFSTGEVALGGKESPLDGMLALYFKTPEDARAALSAPWWAKLVAEERDGADPAAKPVQVLADEWLMSQKPGADRMMKTAGQIKALRTAYRRKDLTHDQFKDYWLKNHSRLEDKVIETTGVQRIVATFALPEPGSEPDFDGMVELYFENVEEIRKMFAGPVPAMMRKDEENFVQMDAPAIRVVSEEYVVADKTATA